MCGLLVTAPAAEAQNCGVGNGRFQNNNGKRMHQMRKKAARRAAMQQAYQNGYFPGQAAAQNPYMNQLGAPLYGAGPGIDPYYDGVAMDPYYGTDPYGQYGYDPYNNNAGGLSGLLGNLVNSGALNQLAGSGALNGITGAGLNGGIDPNAGLGGGLLQNLLGGGF
jgi:hypothetical protein